MVKKERKEKKGKRWKRGKKGGHSWYFSLRYGADEYKIQKIPEGSFIILKLERGKEKSKLDKREGEKAIERSKEVKTVYLNCRLLISN